MDSILSFSMSKTSKLLLAIVAAHVSLWGGGGGSNQVRTKLAGTILEVSWRIQILDIKSRGKNVY